MTQPTIKPRAKVCFETGGKNPFNTAQTASLITLLQHGGHGKLFTVVYGLEVKPDLDYAHAAAKLGQAIMHMQACEGLLDNTGR